MKNYVKMSTESYNQIGEILNKLEIRQGIQNAYMLVQIFEILKGVEVVEEKDEVN